MPSELSSVMSKPAKPMPRAFKNARRTSLRAKWRKKSPDGRKKLRLAAMGVDHIFKWTKSSFPKSRPEWRRGNVADFRFQRVPRAPDIYRRGFGREWPNS